MRDDQLPLRNAIFLWFALSAFAWSAVVLGGFMMIIRYWS